MKRKYRFTGEWPHPNLLSRIPNWEYALGEEVSEGQDETTIRPAADQGRLESDVPFAGADAWLPGSRFLTGMLELDCSVVGFNLYVGGGWYRFVRTNSGWLPNAEPRLAEANQASVIRLDDRRFFPMKIASMVPLLDSGEQIKFVINPDGSESRWGDG